jgi:hypothetical protein
MLWFKVERWLNTNRPFCRAVVPTWRSDLSTVARANIGRRWKVVTIR